MPTEGHASDVVAGDERVYLADFEGGLVVIEPRRSGLTKVGRLDLPAAVAVDVVDGAVFVADQSEGVSVVDASDPEAPVALSTVKVDGACATLDASDEWVAVGDDAGGVTIFARLPDGTLQEWYRIVTGDSITDVALDGDVVWFADGRLGRASLAADR